MEHGTRHHRKQACPAEALHRALNMAHACLAFLALAKQHLCDELVDFCFTVNDFVEQDEQRRARAEVEEMMGGFLSELSMIDGFGDVDGRRLRQSALPAAYGHGAGRRPPNHKSAPRPPPAPRRRPTPCRPCTSHLATPSPPLRAPRRRTASGGC